jgi:ligand-binding sensor domain-containing protein
VDGRFIEVLKKEYGVVKISGTGRSSNTWVHPYLFIDLANDENVQLRNVAIRAVEAGIVTLSQDQRTFLWTSNNRKLMTVPFDENPYSAMAAFFKTDEGIEVFKSIEKKLK